MAITYNAINCKQEYYDFVEKYKPKLTTDECITPDAVYNAVRDFFVERYGLEGCDIVRPFWIGNDYKQLAEDYTDNTVVIDNPPFSIFSEIVDFYDSRGIRFVLFADARTCGRLIKKFTVYPRGAIITYENGARILTSFVTNIDRENAIVLSRELFERVEAAGKKKADEKQKIKRKNKYPYNLISAASLAHYDIDFAIPRDKVRTITKIGDYKIFGAGYVLATDVMRGMREAKEKAYADRIGALKNKLGGGGDLRDARISANRARAGRRGRADRRGAERI